MEKILITHFDLDLKQCAQAKMGVLRNGSIMVMKATTILLAMSVMLMFNIASAYFPYTSLPPPLCSPYYYLKSNLFYGCQIGFMHGLVCWNNVNFHNTNDILHKRHYRYITLQKREVCAQLFDPPKPFKSHIYGKRKPA